MSRINDPSESNVSSYITDFSEHFFFSCKPLISAEFRIFQCFNRENSFDLCFPPSQNTKYAKISCYWSHVTPSLNLIYRCVLSKLWTPFPNYTRWWVSTIFHLSPMTSKYVLSQLHRALGISTAHPKALLSLIFHLFPYFLFLLHLKVSLVFWFFLLCFRYNLPHMFQAY